MNTLIRTLRENGFRLTKPRQQILTILTTTPLSVAEVMELLRNKHIYIDKVTVYRALGCFTKLGIVGKTQFGDNIAKFEMIKDSHHHHHAVCTECGAVEDIPLNETSLINNVKKLTSFHIQSHVLEFFGLCTKCSKQQ